MPYDAPRTCPVCAWRAQCVKRHTMGGDSSLHCPDFSEDVALLRAAEKEAGVKKNSSEKE
ncbi:MAG: hypothetical protein SV239_01740 [Thermodesulfobacteriota bacterium]|nr:hypothetical protein [Thermodesulfobacteriota bacterium]